MPETSKEQELSDWNPNIFISHRHVDEAIATVIKDNLVDWGVPPNAIFKSSEYGGGVPMGGEIKKTLEKLLTATNLLIMVESDREGDRKICYWEHGVAYDPATVRTRFVLFECMEQSDSFFQDSRKVKVCKDDKSDVRSFVNQFLTDDDFIPGQKPFRDEPLPDDALDRYTDRLFEGLLEASRATKPIIGHRWDCLVLYLDPEHVAKIVNAKESEEEDAKEIVFRHSRVTIRRGVFNHFGYGNPPQEHHWKDMVKRWKSIRGGESSSEWIDDVHNQIYRSIKNLSTQRASSEFFSSDRQDKQVYRLLRRASRNSITVPWTSTFTSTLLLSQSSRRSHL